MFLSNIDIVGYVDGNTLYTMNKSTNKVVRDIKMVYEWLFTWLQNSNMKSNPDKFHLSLTDTDCQGMEVSNEKI